MPGIRSSLVQETFNFSGTYLSLECPRNWVIFNKLNNIKNVDNIGYLNQYVLSGPETNKRTILCLKLIIYIEVLFV